MIRNPITGDQVHIGVIGLGYVGLPLALAFKAHGGFEVTGFDTDSRKVTDLMVGIDHSGEVDPEYLKECSLKMTTDPNDLGNCNFFIVTVPTPATQDRVDLKYVRSATEIVAGKLSKGNVVVYESTVAPGTTEKVCVPILEDRSMLSLNEDFGVGFSPERINPGDKTKTVKSILKITSGSSPEYADFIDFVYREIITAGTHKAPSIKVAEAAKIMENIQRDVNIAMVNEMSKYFREAGINTHDVIEAAGTKWNFAKYYPGLVGGHCIGTDTYYYLDSASRMMTFSPVVDAARRYNNQLTRSATYEIIAKSGIKRGAKVLVMGLTFKEDCKDIRNSKVLEMIDTLSKEEDMEVQCWEPVLSQRDTDEIRGPGNTFFLHKKEDFGKYDLFIVAVGHKQFKKLDRGFFVEHARDPQKFFVADIKSLYDFSDWKL